MNIEEFRSKYNIRIDNLEEFTRIQVGEDEEQGFYQQLVECVRDTNTPISIANGIVGNATKEDFLYGEEIIEEVVNGIQPNWTKKQITAYVHYKIGELISYVPDFNFRGMFVNKELSSGTHSFLLVETEDGNIITDPTWDLKNTLYGARPMYFGKTYEQLRKQEEELREIYYTLGYTKENRTFIFPILDKVLEINSNRYENTKDKLNTFFTMFAKEFSQEATHLTETRTILESCLYELGIEPKDLYTKFIYQKDDKSCNNPYLSLLINDEQQKEQEVYCLDLDMMQFRNMDVTELDSKYKIHDLDTATPFWKKYLSRDERDTGELQK